MSYNLTKEALLIRFSRLTVGLILPILLAACNESAHSDPAPFNPALWKAKAYSSDNVRLSMLDDLLTRQTLVGLAREDVLHMLGRPSDSYADTAKGFELLYYPVGQLASGEHVFLTLRLENQRVVEADRWIP